jgi:hypothetical protein
VVVVSWWLEIELPIANRLVLNRFDGKQHYDWRQDADNLCRGHETRSDRKTPVFRAR